MLLCDETTQWSTRLRGGSKIIHGSVTGWIKSAKTAIFKSCHRYLVGFGQVKSINITHFSNKAGHSSLHNNTYSKFTDKVTSKDRLLDGTLFGGIEVK